MTRINPYCHITAFIPFLLVAGEHKPAAACAWSSTEIEISLVFISHSSHHLSSPPFLPSLHPFFFKWRTVMARIEHAGEAGNEGGEGGEKVMGCTIASHTAFKCFSPTHSRNGKWGGLDNMYLCTSCTSRCGKLDCDADSALQRDLSMTQFSLKNTTKKIHHPNQFCFPWPGRKVPLLLGH